jgi:DNA-binding NtrC family response regulator
VTTVLYVDDEEAIRRAVVAWLTRRGHAVHTAATLAEARDVLESRAVDGAFVDLCLGDESGLELQRWIDAHRPDLSNRLVFVTGDPGAGESGSGARSDLIRPVLVKPFDLTELDAFVQRWTAPE